MKKLSKKALAVLLSVLMIMTAVGVSFTAGAKEYTCEELTAAINDLPSSGISLKGTDKEKYENVCQMFNSMTDEEKDKLDANTFYKFVKVGQQAEGSDKKGFLALKDKVALPSFVDETIALWKTLSAKDKSSDYYIDAYKNASAQAKALAGCYNETEDTVIFGMQFPGEGHFKTDPAGNTMITEKLFFKNLVAALKVEEPYTGTAVSSVAAPKPSSFAKVDGKYKNNEEYKAALEQWIVDITPYVSYKNDQNAYNAKMQVKALNMIGKVNDTYSAYAEFTDATVNGYYEHLADNTNIKNAEKAIKLYENLTAFDKKCVSNGPVADLIYTALNLNESKDTTAAATKDTKTNLNTLFTNVQSFALEGMAKEFDEYIASIESPYSRETINEAKEKYAEIPTVVRDMLQAETVAKFAEIKASITEDERTGEADLSAYTPIKTTDIAPGVKYKSAVKSSEGIVTLLKKVVPNDALKSTLDKALTNENVGKATVMLHTLLIDKLGSTAVNLVSPPFAKTPKDFIDIYVAKNDIKDERTKFAGAIAKLGAASSWDEVSTFENGDWGFEDGDVDGFVDALIMSLRDISMTLFDEAIMGQHVIGVTNNIDTVNGTYSYGAYEELIDLLEVLDLKGVISSDEYTRRIDSLNYRHVDGAAEKENMKIELAESYLRPIVEPIAELVKELENDCYGTLVNYLPKIAYAVDSGLADECVHNFLNYLNSLISMFAPDINNTLAGFKLDTGAVYEMLAPTLRAVSINGTDVSIDISREQFATLISQLAGCSESVAKPTVKAAMKTRAGLDTDKEKTMYVVVNFLLDFAKTENGKETIKDVVNAIDANATIKSLVSGLLTGFASFNRRTAFTLLSVFIPMANIIIVVVNFFQSLLKVFKK